jgi:hypothetical protein
MKGLLFLVFRIRFSPGQAAESITSNIGKIQFHVPLPRAMGYLTGIGGLLCHVLVWLIVMSASVLD